MLRTQPVPSLGQPERVSLAAVLAACLLVAPTTACVTARGPHELPQPSAAGAAAASDWSRVREIQAGTDLIVTTRQARAGARLFVAADESRLILLNVTAPALPDTVKRVLRDMAMRRPDQFLALPPTGGFGQGTVRLGRAGIFVGDQKVADLEQVVETLDAREVREIHGPVVVHGTPLATVVSGVLGFFLGAGSQSLRAALIFGVAGGSLGYFFWESTSAGLIYTAP